VTLCST
jgi:P-type Ca2+ transporter type 2C